MGNWFWIEAKGFPVDQLISELLQKKRDKAFIFNYKKKPPGSGHHHKKTFLNGYTFFTTLTVLATKPEVPVPKGLDGRI